MLALHAGFNRQHLVVWGESSENVPEPERHPLDAGPATLSKVLASVGIRIASILPDDSEVWVPATRTAPLPSSPLIAESPRGAKLAIRPWTVASYPLSPASAINLLCAAVESADSES